MELEMSARIGRMSEPRGESGSVVAAKEQTLSGFIFPVELTICLEST